MGQLMKLKNYCVKQLNIIFLPKSMNSNSDYFDTKLISFYFAILFEQTVETFSAFILIQFLGTMGFFF